MPIMVLFRTLQNVEKDKKEKQKGKTTSAHPAQSTTPKPKRKRRKRKKRLRVRKKLHSRRHKRPHSRSAEELVSVQALDTAVDEMQGIFVNAAERKQLEAALSPPVTEFTPFQALAGADTPLNGFKPTSDRDFGYNIMWTAWGLWSPCSVTCGKGKQFRRRECIQRIGDTFEGQAVKSLHCPGGKQDKKYCSDGSCSLSGESRPLVLLSCIV